MSEDLLMRVVGRAGRVTLNRPDALNALTYGMIREIEVELLTWREDPAVELVVIDGAGERAFCAGGDIQDLYRSGRAGDFGFGRKFWADEYRLNALIAEFPKPFVAIMHGFVMGGGVGVSALGSHRVVTDGTQVAMPECGIGLIPDVGGSFLLSRAPGALGAYLGTTGARMDAGDAIHAGFADVYVPRVRLADLIAALEAEGIGALDRFVEAPAAAELAGIEADLGEVFSLGDVPSILAALAARDADWAGRAAKALARNCPLSVACTLEAVRQASTLPDVRAALALEYRFSWRCMEEGEFLEGVRAAVIDKDRSPRWARSHEDITPAEVEAMLAPLGENELQL